MANPRYNRLVFDLLVDVTCHVPRELRPIHSSVEVYAFASGFHLVLVTVYDVHSRRCDFDSQAAGRDCGYPYQTPPPLLPSGVGQLDRRGRRDQGDAVGLLAGARVHIHARGSVELARPGRAVWPKASQGAARRRGVSGHQDAPGTERLRARRSARSVSS
ncbi:hypothetical protein QYE76_050287 [Lolium multiflorum]|uniref:Uncharacterized protein n=1 Tax=Lolium multiflorum TaxID=4521 RepID=A0AAD8SPL8_LOLMU|nr:hypothetical protein QYE76_050287 [Lolium multiflorum]